MLKCNSKTKIFWAQIIYRVLIHPWAALVELHPSIICNCCKNRKKGDRHSIEKPKPQQLKLIHLHLKKIVLTYILMTLLQNISKRVLLTSPKHPKNPRMKKNRPNPQMSTISESNTINPIPPTDTSHLSEPPSPTHTPKKPPNANQPQAGILKASPEPRRFSKYYRDLEGLAPMGHWLKDPQALWIDHPPQSRQLPSILESRDWLRPRAVMMWVEVTIKSHQSPLRKAFRTNFRGHWVGLRRTWHQLRSLVDLWARRKRGQILIGLCWVMIRWICRQLTWIRRLFLRSNEEIE